MSCLEFNVKLFKNYFLEKEHVQVIVNKKKEKIPVLGIWDKDSWHNNDTIFHLTNV